MFSTLLKTNACLQKYDSIHQAMSKLNLKRFAMGGAVMNRFWVPVLCSTGYLYFLKRAEVKCKDTKKDVEKFQTRRDNMRL